VDRAAALGRADAFKFPRPLCDKPSCDFSFSGIKTSVRTTIANNEQQAASSDFINDVCASFNAAVVDCVLNRLTNALRDPRVIAAAPTAIVVAGGVAKNPTIRAGIEKLATENNMEYAAPPLSLCTDNGAMIAWAGIENFLAGHVVTEPVAPRPRWPLTELN